MIIKNHPNPIFARKRFMLLDGEWDFEIDKTPDGFKRGLINSKLKDKIIVPFCPESIFSGVGEKSASPYVWYQRKFTLTKVHLSQKIVLNFGAVNYEAYVYINGIFAGRHIGGHTPFSFDITNLAVKKEGIENLITAYVINDVLDKTTASGKQTDKDEAYGCFYTRCTGIWQSVWLEFMPPDFILGVRFYPNILTGSVLTELSVQGKGDIAVRISYQGKKMSDVSLPIDHKASIEIPLDEVHLWEVGQGKLYEVKITFSKDTVYSYFGMRTVGYSGKKFQINGKTIFQRLVLDQGYYYGGLYTPKRQGDFEQDIIRALSFGFNGARLHQKVFDPKYLYYCDIHGFMVWGEYPSWGIDYTYLNGFGFFLEGWREAVERDFNHPSIVTWCPLNEVWKSFDEKKTNRDVRFIEALYQTTKILDKTRPCVDSSGGYHSSKTDLFDFHSYDDFSLIKEYLDDLEQNGSLERVALLNPPQRFGEKTPYDGGPVNVSEYGGFALYLAEKDDNAWGYGKALQSPKELVDKYTKVTALIKQYPAISGFCYTQLYDVEQESNGLFTFDRKCKLNDEQIKIILACNKQSAAIEERTKGQQYEI